MTVESLIMSWLDLLMNATAVVLAELAIIYIVSKISSWLFSKHDRDRGSPAMWFALRAAVNDHLDCPVHVSDPSEHGIKKRASDLSPAGRSRPSPQTTGSDKVK